MAKRGRPKKVVAKEETAVVKAPVKVPMKQISEQTMAALVLKGDLSGMNPVQKMEYYHRLCEHLHLDPVTRPFDIINIRGKEIMYAHKGCTDQLRKQNGVSVTDIKGETVADVYRVTAIGHDKTGRTDAATGVVSIGKLGGDELANALMKAETKAKRRLTLSLCGLGMLDESEIETIPGAINVEFNGTTEIVPASPETMAKVLPKTEGEYIETEVGDVPKVFWKARDKMVLFEAFGPAVDYRVAKNSEGVWKVTKVEQKAFDIGVKDADIPF